MSKNFWIIHNLIDKMCGHGGSRTQSSSLQVKCINRYATGPNDFSISTNLQYKCIKNINTSQDIFYFFAEGEGLEPPTVISRYLFSIQAPRPAGHPP